MVRAAIEADSALLNAKDAQSDDRTALHSAAASGSYGVVQALLALGAEVNTKDGTGFTPLISAVSAGKPEVVKELLGAGADVKAKNAREQTALHYAASKGWVEVCLQSSLV